MGCHMVQIPMEFSRFWKKMQVRKYTCRHRVKFGTAEYQKQREDLKNNQRRQDYLPKNGDSIGL